MPFGPGQQMYFPIQKVTVKWWPQGLALHWVDAADKPQASPVTMTDIERMERIEVPVVTPLDAYGGPPEFLLPPTKR